MNDRVAILTLQQNDESALRQWLSVIAVAATAFAFVTSEFLPVGLLPAIARELGITVGTAGLMVTMPAVMAAISAPGLVMFAGRMDRRKVFLLLTAMLLASDLVCGLAKDLTTMLVGRAMLGAALGGFWTLATAAAGRLVHAKDAARATAIILAGVTFATVIGVPLGTFIAGFASWRMSFFFTAGLIALALIAQALLVPSLPSAAALSVTDLVTLLRRPHTRLSMTMVALVFGAHFSTYTFVTPLLRQNFGMSAITLLLLAFGAVGFVSNALMSMVVARRLKTSVASMAGLLLAALATMLLLGHARIAEVAAMLMWGIAFGAIPLCFSVWIQTGTADLPEAGSAMFVGVIQVAIALGSLVGGTIVDHAGAGADLIFGGGLAVLGLVTLQRLAAMERPASMAAAEYECSASID